MQGRKNRILIIDDDTEYLDELKSMLVLAGYEVTEEADSSLAVKKAREVKPDLILLDLKMSPPDGFDINDELKEYKETVNTPIIAITGFYTANEDYKYLNSIGIRKCLKKPFNPLDVIVEIERTLGHA
jgi:DNA-binding response OmpR family regulator